MSDSGESCSVNRWTSDGELTHDIPSRHRHNCSEHWCVDVRTSSGIDGRQQHHQHHAPARPLVARVDVIVLSSSPAARLHQPNRDWCGDFTLQTGWQSLHRAIVTTRVMSFRDARSTMMYVRAAFDNSRHWLIHSSTFARKRHFAPGWNVGSRRMRNDTFWHKYCTCTAIASKFQLKLILICVIP